jgi:hypothetical protein
MRTTTILAVGLLLLTATFLFGKLFTQYYPSAMSWALGGFLALWLLATGFNLWVGVNRAGYSVGEELPIMLLLFLLPATAAGLVKWKFF